MTAQAGVAERGFDAHALSRCRIVLVGAQHPGNIGAVARAMKVMGLTDLALVAPEQYPHADATARASGADDVLDRARVFQTLDAAIADCGLAVGTSARSRRTEWPCTDVRGAATRAIEHGRSAPVALVFGRERSGLSNDELDCCQLLMHVPSNPDYCSLNLASAVQVVCYELRMAAGDTVDSAANAREPVPQAEMAGLFDHWQAVLTAAGYFDKKPSDRLMRRVRRLFYRAEPDRAEINILRGALHVLDPRRRGH